MSAVLADRGRRSTVKANIFTHFDIIDILQFLFFSRAIFLMHGMNVENNFFFACYNFRGKIFCEKKCENKTTAKMSAFTVCSSRTKHFITW